MIDTHLHLNRREFADDRDQVRDRARDAGVAGFINVGYDLESSRASVDLSAAHPEIRATVGIHPHDAALLADPEGRLTQDGRRCLAVLADLATAPGVVAIGEIGLDFYRDLSPRPAQRTALIAQLELAGRLDLPVVFHIRDAYPETLALVDEVGLPTRGAVLHSFAGEAAHARWARDRGCLLGIGGPITYKNSQLPQVLAKAGVTAADVLLETDAPWLPPVPHRGRRNEPAFLVHTCETLAAVLGLEAATLARATDANVARRFGPWPGVLDGPRGGGLE
ncbi:MAG: TatD family hydrolase [Candidatus Krumholzibacteriia bacterium]